MIRFVVIFALVALGIFAAWRIVGMARNRQLDWTGIGLAVLFVILAFWLSDLTGIGGVAS